MARLSDKQKTFLRIAKLQLETYVETQPKEIERLKNMLNDLYRVDKVTDTKPELEEPIAGMYEGLEKLESQLDFLEKYYKKFEKVIK